MDNELENILNSTCLSLRASITLDEKYTDSKQSVQFSEWLKTSRGYGEVSIQSCCNEDNSLDLINSLTALEKGMVVISELSEEFLGRLKYCKIFGRYWK